MRELDATEIDHVSGGATGGWILGLAGLMDWNHDGDPFDEIRTIAGIGGALTAPLALIPGLQGAALAGAAGFGAVYFMADWLDQSMARTR